MTGLSKALAGMAVAALAAAAVTPAAGARGSGAQGSDNLTRLAQVPIAIDKDRLARGSDLAIQEDLLFAGTYQGLGIFEILDRKPYVKQLSFLDCPGSQGDVSVHGDYVFYSIDSPGSNSGAGPGCNNTDDSTNAEGVRIIDVSDPKTPRQVAFVETQCGSHTHTILPHRGDIFVYVLSYPIVQEADCNVGNHRKVSVIKVPGGNVRKAKVVSMPDVSPAIGCHDVTVFPPEKLAVAACITEAQIWDISEPAQPEILAHIYNPFVNIWHSGGVTWDGKYAVFGDEFLGSITGTCTGPRQNTIGAMWFYDIRDPSAPSPAGYYGVPRPHPIPGSLGQAAYLKCTTHNYNVLPMRKKGSYVASIGLRSSGMTVVDFSDPSQPEELAWFQADEALPDTWSAYWYNGRIYANDNASNLGIGVFEVKGLDARRVRFFDDRLNPQVQIPDFR